LGGAFGYHTNFWRTQARFDSALTDKTDLRLTVAYGRDDMQASVGTNLFDASLRPLTSRAELSSSLARGVRANFGLDVAYTHYDYALQLPAPSRPGVPSGGPGQLPIRSTGSLSRFQPAAYTELEITPWRGGRIVPGLRADYDSTSDRADLSPRVTVRQDLTHAFPRLTLKGGWGLFSQPATPLDTDSRLGQPGLISNRAIHYDVGLEQELTRQLDLSVDIFYKDLTNLVVANAKNAGAGAAYGAEWLLRYKADERFFGWASYTLSRSERRDVPGEPNTRYQYDQTHVLTLVGNYKLGRHWQLGARYRVTSGELYTPVGIGAYNATVGAQLGVADFPAYGSRLPAFHQLDLRLEKSWLGKHTISTFFLDLQNPGERGSRIVARRILAVLVSNAE
jgi:TonB-dependent receptor-like protein